MKFIKITFLTFTLISCGAKPNPDILTGLVPSGGTYSAPIPTSNPPIVSENHNAGCGLNPYRSPEGFCLAKKEGRTVRVGGGCCN